MESKKIKIALAEDGVTFRDMLKRVLNQEDQFNVIIEAGDGKELLSKMENNVPDVVLMDLHMKNGMNGFEATKRVKLKYGDKVRVIGLSDYDEAYFAVRFIDEGGSSFIIKNAGLDATIDEITQVVNDDSYKSEHVEKALNRKRKPFVKQFEHTLKEEDIELLRLVCQGWTDEEIGNRLFKAKKTIEKKRQALQDRFLCKKKVQLVDYALKNGLID